MMKTDLDLRPIYHKNDESTMAHLHLGILAYWLLNSIRYQLKQKGTKGCWQEIIRKANTQKIITTTGTNLTDSIIGTRRCSEPNPAIQSIYEALGYKSKPFVKRKFVVHKSKPEKIKSIDNQQLT
jgi:hypothetical protein